jgi:hypothetical protein
MKFLIMQSSAPSHQFLHLRSIYSQHPILPLVWETKFHAHTNQQVKLVLYILILKFLERRRNRQILNWMVASIPWI